MQRKHYALVLAFPAVIAACSADVITTSSSLSAPQHTPRYSISGAFNTNAFDGTSCVGVNGNKYASKSSVYLNGSPSTVEPGSYYVKVESPNGLLLGVSSSASFVVDGVSATCAQLISIVNKASDPAVAGFDDTNNPGGEYKVTISHTADFPGGDVKSDNFKVLEDQTITTASDVSINKFYDANGDGDQDGGEPSITGWKVNITPFVGTASDVFTPWTGSLDAGQYTITEYMPSETNWFNTTGPTNPVTIGGATVITFGNYCTYAGIGARTIGYWKTHQAATTVLLPVTLYTGVTVSTWTQAYAIINGASSKDANVMLKAQLLAAVLNVKQDASFGAVYIPQFGKTVNQVIADAQAFLAVNGAANLTKDSPARTQALDIKTQLDKINNSTESNFGLLTLINAVPCAFTFP
jgi:hypothetical protein